MALHILGRPWLLATLGQGVLSSTSTVAPPSGTSPENPHTIECNPYSGQRYLTFGNGNGILTKQCKASWDLHEIQLWDESGELITGLSAFSSTGEGGSDFAPSKAIDGDMSTFFAGDYDVGMSCECWEPSKKDAQTITVDLGRTQKVSKITLQQGGAGNKWAVSNIRIHCGNGESFLQTHPLPFDISLGATDIECNEAGCAVTRMSPAYQHTCDGGDLPTSSWATPMVSSCYLLLTILLGPALTQLT